VVYDPGDIFAGLGIGQTATDSFTYSMVDSHGAASTATVNLTISGGGVVFDPRLRIIESVNEDAVTGNLYELINEAMAQFGPQTSLVSIDTAGTRGTVAFDPDAHVLTYAADHPSLDSLAPDTQAYTSFFYTVRTPGGDLRTGEIKMQVLGINDSAVAVDDALAVQEGGVIDLFRTLTLNDIDPDSLAFQFVSVNTAGTLGRITFDPMSTVFRYAADTPELLALDPGETLIDSFTYTIRDRADGDNGPTSTATVTVTVTGGEQASMSVATNRPMWDDLGAMDLHAPWFGQADLLI
jgi:VCBS repeat-containing protein